MTREEFESLLEEAFMAGYNAVLEEVFEEDNRFDLEEEMDAYTENTNRKHPERGTLSRVVRASSKLDGTDRLGYWGGLAAAANATSKANKLGGVKDFDTLEKIGTKAAQDYYRKKININDRINMADAQRKSLTKLGYDDKNTIKAAKQYLMDRMKK